jgi:hypothetical protein
MDQEGFFDFKSVFRKSSGVDHEATQDVDKGRFFNLA